MAKAKKGLVHIVIIGIVAIIAVIGVGSLFNRGKGLATGAVFGDISEVGIFDQVCIGVTTPANKLDVAGGVAIGEHYAGKHYAPNNGLKVEGQVFIGGIGPGLEKLGVQSDSSDSGTFAMGLSNAGGTPLFNVRSGVHP